ncbi:BUD32 family EKC/KEOPS complex subunit [Neisseria zalophi]|uniref:Protein kinase family protein n=1 Tax=Neisseria zalophi TaxID=640030 RepID=A0A5J6PXI5_9NEIS|nr:protein kinase family protein [Neisseria zalophi]QEY25612.1 protein kinase family protein [Neisseria zalophi]
MSENINSLSEYAHKLLIEHKDERIFPFKFQGKRFWLKQPEHTHGISRLLKPHPKQSFLGEIERLRCFSIKNAPIPKLILFNNNFFILEDGGKTIDNLLAANTNNPEFKKILLSDSIKALNNLHKANLIHGRPAIRDMTWDNHHVLFIDFEVCPKRQNLQSQKARDMAIFFHGLCRKKFISDDEIKYAITQYQNICDPQLWQVFIQLLTKYQFAYHILRPFKSILGTDLIAVYRLFDIFLTEKLL